MALGFPPDTDHRRHRPLIATGCLLALMAGAYLASLLFDLPYEAAVRFGVVPENPHPLGLLGALVLHASGVHFFFNAALLWFFARDVEDEIGPWGVFAFYFLGGLATHLTQIGAVRLFMPTEQDLPIIGASGAVSVLMGAFAGLFPGARIVPASARPPAPNAPVSPGIAASWVWGIWLALQGLGMVGNLFGVRGEVGYWGHAFGFALGAGGALLLHRLRRNAPQDGSPAAGRLADSPSGLSEGTSAFIAARYESLGDPEVAKTGVAQALKRALERGNREDAWAAYAWLAERRALTSVSPGDRLAVARLLEEGGRHGDALAALQQLALESPPEAAATALLEMARLLAGPMEDIPRAVETLRFIESRYAGTPVAPLATAERERLQLPT